MFGANYKTSIFGIIAIVGAAVAVWKCFHCADCDTMQCIATALTGTGIGGGLLMAKDKDTVGAGATAQKVAS